MATCRPNVLFITADQWRGDCLTRGRAPGRAHAEPRPARRRRRLVPAPLRAGGAVRAEPGVALHRHVPDEPPVGAQRHPARRPPHERRPRGPRARLRARAVRLHRHEHRPPHRRRPTTRACSRTKACSPASTRCATSPRATRTRGSTGCAPTGVDVPDDWRAFVDQPGRRARGGARSTTPSTRRPCSSPTACSTSSTTVGGEPAVVRAPLVPAPAPAVPRARAVRHDVRPRVGPGAGARADARRRRRAAPAARRDDRPPVPQVARRRRRSSASSRRPTTG